MYKTHQVQIFFIKDKIDRREVVIEHQLTDKMWSDILTKTKQGKGFWVDWSHLMNVPQDTRATVAVQKEWVGLRIKNTNKDNGCSDHRCSKAALQECVEGCLVGVLQI